MDEHNAKWTERWQRFLNRVPPPRWEPTIPVSADWRALYESYVPVAEYVASLRRIARLALPHPSWIPTALALSTGHTTARSACFASLPDLWSYLPSSFAGTVQLQAGELPALLAALADPAQFGTADGRYPEQLNALRHWAHGCRDRQVTLLDLGCGTGEGTREAASVLREEGLNVQAVGITYEPLEAWMANTGYFPHRPLGARASRPHPEAGGTPALNKTRHVHKPISEATFFFLAGDATALPCRQPCHIILCNGLVGGRFLHTDTEYQRLLAEFSRVLAPGGMVLFGCRFHAGREPHLARFRDMATAAGWRAQGPLRDLILTR